MTINKFFKRSLMTTIPAGLVLLASFTPTITLSSQSLQNSQTTSTISPRADSTVQTDTIDIAKVSKNNWSWPKDSYGITNGYRYITVNDPNTSVFTLDSKGLVFNTNYPKYSLKSDFLPATNWSVYYGTTSVNLDITSQKYTQSTNEINTASTTSKTMIFGNTDSDTFSGFSSQSLSIAQPYLKLSVPIVDYKIREHKGIISGGDALANIAYERYSKSLRRYNNAYVSYDGITNEINKEIVDPNHQFPPGAAETAWHWHSQMGTYRVGLSIYNDYDANGILLGTHLLNNGDSFNTILPTMTIDETKLNKDYNALRQNTDISGLVVLSNAQSLPSLGGATLTVTKDVFAGKLTFAYKPNFIFSNGTLQKYTGSAVLSKDISGFSLLNTFISPRAGYSDVIVVDRFINSIRKDGVIDPVELGKYLDLSTVPPGSSYSILDSSIKFDLVKGTIEFQINASNGYNYDSTLTGQTTPNYAVNLQLNPRITKIDCNGYLDDLLVTQYYDRVFDQTGLVNLDEFNKYATIIAPVDDAQYYLVPDSYVIDTGDGTVDFKIYASTYYGSDAQEKTGIENDTTTHLDVNLVLNPLPSKAVVKDNYVPAHRVDKFIDLVANTDGSVKNLDLLKEYVDMENIPTAATYTIDLNSVQYDPFNADFYYEYVNFNLVINKYNETSFVSGVPKTLPLRVKLNAMHLQTKITAKLPTEYDASIRIDRLLPKIINADNIVTNRALLEAYVNIESLPQASVLKIDNIVRDDATGILNFNVIPTIAYDDDSNKLLNQTYPVRLELTMRHQPTVITAKQNIVGAERVDRFASVVGLLNGSGELIKYLTATQGGPAYIDISGEWPIPIEQIDFQVRNLKYTDFGDLSFNLIASTAYDADAEIAGTTAFPINLQLAQKHAPTSVSLSPHYPQGSTVTEFIDLANSYASDQTALRSFLSRFMSGINTIPVDAIISWTQIDANHSTGQVTFSVEANKYYDYDSDLINSKFTSGLLTLNLIPQDQIASLTTSIEWQNDASISGKAQDFYQLVNPNNQVNYAELSNYLVLNNIPIDATITIVNKDPGFKSPLFLQFDVVLTQWWETGSLKPVSGDTVVTKHIPLERNLFILNVNSKAVTFPWWWIAVAVGGVIILLTTYFLAKQYKEEKWFKNKALGKK